MRDEQLKRYSRHLLLPEIDIAGQTRLLNARALIIGLGGIGSPVAMYLASSGVGELVLCDFDRVELTNLQRQIVHHTDDLGRLKTESAQDEIRALNPDVQVTALATNLSGKQLEEEVHLADVVIDASDNFSTRFALNAACVGAGTPLVAGAATGWRGQVTTIHPGLPGAPCYRCLYPDDASSDREDCASAGVFAPLTGIIGCIQTAESLKILLGVGNPLSGRLVQVDAMTMKWRETRFTQDPRCPACVAPKAS